MTKQEKIKQMLTAYIAAALWSSYNHDNEEEEFLDENYSEEDITEHTKKVMKADVTKFVNENWLQLEESNLSPEEIGHDFWLTRHHHGAGFWDRDLPQKIADHLTEASQKFPEFILWVDLGEVIGNTSEKGKVHGE